MWAALTFILQYLTKLADAELATIIKNQETIMSKQDEILADLTDVKTNLAETQGDLNTILSLNQAQTTSIATLEAAVADLQAQLGEGANLDAILSAVADVKATSRAVADVYTPPVTPPAVP